MEGKLSYGADYAYANDRLHETVVVLNGKPFYVHEVTGRGLVRGVNLCTGEQEEAQLNALDLTPPKLGYVNLQMDAVYLTRMPIRHYRQGIRSANLSVKKVGRSNGMLENIVHNQIKQPIMNDYPDVDFCIEALSNGEYRERAFHKHFSLKLNKDRWQLNYKAVHVGGFNPKKGTTLLGNDYQFLKETVDEVMV